MIYSLTGPLLHAETNAAVVECGGVGFYCRITGNTRKKLPALGEKVKLFTFMNVRQDAIELFGFAQMDELHCFKLLTAVSGVGPKVGLAILSALTPEKVALSVATSDAKAITAAPGVGPKLAQRIILELKDKVTAPDAETGIQLEEAFLDASGNAGRAVGALKVLGYSTAEASGAVAKLDGSLPVETLIREALKSMAKL